VPVRRMIINRFMRAFTPRRHARSSKAIDARGC
jgi:hypothetical protein